MLSRGLGCVPAILRDRPELSSVYPADWRGIKHPKTSCLPVGRFATWRLSAYAGGVKKSRPAWQRINKKCCNINQNYTIKYKTHLDQ